MCAMRNRWNFITFNYFVQQSKIKMFKNIINTDD